MVVKVWPGASRQQLQIFETEEKSDVPFEDDPPLRLKSQPKLVFNRLFFSLISGNTGIW